MLEEPLPNGDTTDRNKQLVRNDFNVFTNQRCHLSEDSIPARLLKEAISVQPEASTKFKDKNQNSKKKNAKRVHVLRLTEIHHHGDVFTAF